MAIQDDIIIDVVNDVLDYSPAFVDDRPPTIHTVLATYSYLQDFFDEPQNLKYTIPMSAQTPTQFSMTNRWYITTRLLKALYGGSIQSLDWTKSGAAGITMLRYANGAADAPIVSDEGVTLTGGTSTATGVLLEVDTVRQVCWVRNTSAAQFQNGEAVTGTGVSFTTEATNGFQTGETEVANLFSVGSIQENTEIYVGQEDDYMGGRAYHTANPERRRIEKVDEWWDADVDFTGSTNLIGGPGHFDILIPVRESGAIIDGRRLAVFARQFSKVYSAFELTGGAGNFVVPFASTGADLNSQDGPYQANFINNSGTIAVGDILENDTGTTPVGRLRAVVTGGTNLASASGTIEYYLIGENEPLTTTDRTLKQFANLDNVRVRGGSPTFDISGAPSQVAAGPAVAGGITVTFGNATADINEDSTTEVYAATVNCNSLPLARVYKHLMFLAARGNQDGTTADTQDTLLPTAVVGVDEAGEFYRAVGDIVITSNAKTGTGIAEGDYVTGTVSGATGIVVQTENTATGFTTLTSVKGTFQAAEDISADGGTNSLTIAGGGISTIVDNTGAPFGTFAGGRFFVARGVLLTNVAAADANNWETVDLGGNRIAPPTQRSITFAGLVAGDRAALYEVDTAGQTNITKNQNGVASGGAVGAASFVLDTTIALDVPTTGWVHVVDVSATDGFEQRLAYSSISGTTVTFDQGAWSTGTTTGSESATVLTDTGAFTNFGGAGEIRIGMLIRNDTLGEWAYVVRKIDNDSIETTPLSGGGNWHSGGTADTWTANAPVVAFDAADTCYFPFIDDVSLTTSLSKTIKYVADTPCVARARFSSPDIGGQRILPFQLTGVTVTDADLTVTAIRTDDTIAS